MASEDPAHGSKAGDLTKGGTEGPRSDDVSISSQFWTSPYGLDSSGNKLQRRDPKLQYRFKVVIPGFAFEDAPGSGPPDNFNDKPDSFNGVAWYAKSVDKPGMTIEDPNRGLYATNSIPLKAQPKPDAPKYKEINMVLVDPYYPNVTRKIARLFRRGGLNESQAKGIIARTYGTDPDAAARSFLETIGVVEIHQLNGKGQSIEKWTLFDAYPNSVDFGKLDYSSDGLVEISLTWYYKYFKVDFPSVGPEEAFRYFSDGNNLDLTKIRPTTGAAKQTCREKFDKLYKRVEPKPNFENWLAAGNCVDYQASASPLPDPGETGDEPPPNYPTSAFNEETEQVEVLEDNGDIYVFDPSIESLPD